MSRQKGIVPLALLLIVGLFLGLGFFVYTQISNPKVDFNATPTPSPFIESEIVASKEVTQITLSEPTWLSSPQPISSLNKSLFEAVQTSEDVYGYAAVDEARYYRVATFQGEEELINAFLPCNCPGSDFLWRFIKTSDNTFYYIKETDDNWNNEAAFEILLPEVKVTEVTIKGLETPQEIKQDGKTFTIGYETNATMEKNQSYTKVLDTEYGPIYRQVGDYSTTGINSITNRTLYLLLKDGVLVNYSLASDFDGNFKGDTFGQRVFLGCGGPSGLPIIADSSLLDQKVEVGKTKSGQTLYQIQEVNHQLTTDVYEKVYLLAPLGEPVSKENFAKGNYNILVQDPIGDWQVYVNTKYEPQAECAKPVIYLYPEVETQVSVQVGADVTISEPLYPQEGWTVLASPNGTLKYQGNTYPNLFWEGQGTGVYPFVANSGTVVTQKDLLLTLRSQLTQLGLNEQEAKDFMDFWEEKLPTTPFVRLTWIGTSQMNELAPLTVTPRPDTTIRIFLEFEGLEKPIALTPQKLSAPQRRGFTLVEWGGLLVK